MKFPYNDFGKLIRRALLIELNEGTFDAKDRA